MWEMNSEMMETSKMEMAAVANACLKNIILALAVHHPQKIYEPNAKLATPTTAPTLNVN